MNNVFDMIAESFDTRDKLLRAKLIADEIRGRIRDGGGKTAIEFGCGTGLVGLRLLDDFDELLFVDSSAGMLEQLKRKLTELGRPLSTVICRDVIDSGSGGLRADYIFTSMTLHHIKDTDVALSRLYDMLAPSGRLIIIELDKDDGSFHAHHDSFDGHHGFRQETLAGQAEKAGFINVAAKTFYRGSKIVNGKEEPHTLFILDAERPDTTSAPKT